MPSDGAPQGPDVDARMTNLREWAEGYRDADGMDQHRRAQVLDLLSAVVAEKEAHAQETERLRWKVREVREWVAAIEAARDAALADRDLWRTEWEQITETARVFQESRDAALADRDRLAEALESCLFEANDAITGAGADEDETYCFGNLIHVRRRAAAALATPQVYERVLTENCQEHHSAALADRDRLAEALGELADAAKEYRTVVAGWFDFTDTDAYDELNAALVHADRALATPQAPQ